MEPKERILHMLTSKDPEMQNLGLATFGHLLKTWSEYNWIRSQPSYTTVPVLVKRAARKVMINSHGKLRKRFKEANGTTHKGPVDDDIKG